MGDAGRPGSVVYSRTTSALPEEAMGAVATGRLTGASKTGSVVHPAKRGKGYPPTIWGWSHDAQRPQLCR